MLIKVKQMENS